MEGSGDEDVEEGGAEEGSDVEDAQVCHVVSDVERPL